MIRGSRVLQYLGIALAIAGGGASGSSAPDGSRAQSSYVRDYYGREVPVFQCGLYCTAVQLAICGIGYDVDVLQRHLDCTEKGTSLASVAMVLEAHGLRVKSVKSLNTRALENHLKAGGSAVISVGIMEERVHFLSVVRYGGREFLCIDFPSGCFKAARKAMENTLERWGGVGLLVEKRPREASAETGVIIVPGNVDLGDLTKLEEKPKATLAIKNNSSQVRIVSKVRAACGCMGVEVEPKWLEPGESGSIVCTLRPGAWGYSDKNVVYLELADGAVLSFAVSATGPQPAVPAVVANPSSFFLAEAVFEGDRVQRTIRLQRTRNTKFEVLRADSTVPWIEPQLAEKPTADSDNAVINLTISRSKDYGLSRGEVRVFFKDVAEPLLIPVGQERMHPLRASAYVVHFVEGEVMSSAVDVWPVDQSISFALIDVKSDNPLILAEWDRGGRNEAATVNLKIENSDCFSRAKWAVCKLLILVKQGETVSELPLTAILQGRAR